MSETSRVMKVQLYECTNGWRPIKSRLQFTMARCAAYGCNKRQFKTCGKTFSLKVPEMIMVVMGNVFLMRKCMHIKKMT